MIQSRKCDGVRMHCNQFNCFSVDVDYSDEYTYFGDAVQSNKKCSFINRQVTGHDLTSSLFSDQSDKCKATDGFCLQTDSIIVWEPDEIIHKCPFTIIATLSLEHFDGDMLYCEPESLAFQVISKSNECEEKIDIYLTNEGLYLIPVNVSQSYSELSKQNLTLAINKNLLLLADSDSAKIQQMKIYREINQRNCYNLMNTLSIAASSDSKDFLTISDYEGKILVLYVFRNLLYIPKCQEIKSIMVQKVGYLLAEGGVRRICYRNINAFVRNGNSTEMVFLQKGNILKSFSSKVDCKSMDMEQIVAINKTMIIQRTSNETSTYHWVSNSSLIYTKINGVMNDFSKLNFNHFNMLLRSVDTPQTFLEAINSIDEHDTFHRITGLTENSLDLNFGIKSAIDSVKSYWKSFKTIFIIVISALIAILLLIIILCIVMKIKRRKPTYRNVNLIEGFLLEPTQASKTAPVYQVKANRSRSFSPRSKYMDPTTDECLNRLQNKANRGIF